jgi:tetratricopeptide (TPR) repeat protein
LGNIQQQMPGKKKNKTVLVLSITLGIIALVAVLAFLPSIVGPVSSGKTATEAFNLGFAAFNDGNWDLAIEEYTEGIRLNPNDAVAYHNRGAAYANKGDYASAIKDYENALNIDPNSPNTSQYLEQVRQQYAALTAIYRIGDRGPAGGIIFYDKGQYTDGWRYLEAAPSDIGPTHCGRLTDAGTDEVLDYIEGIRTERRGRGIGAGKRNTEILVAELNRNGESRGAAQLARAYTLNGYNDWFLPNIDELKLIYENLRKNSLGGFRNGWYLSSNVFSSNTVFGMKFSDGDYTNFSTYDADNYVRPIRAF